MKTMINHLALSLFVGSFLCVVFSGCDKKDYEEFSRRNSLNQDHPKVEISAFSQMQMLNDSLLSTKMTRSWAGFWNACSIAGADITGFGAGAATVSVVAGMVGAATAGTGFVVVSGIAGTICAVGASRQAYVGIYRCALQPELRPDIINPPTLGKITAGALSDMKLKKVSPELMSKINLPQEYAYLNDAGVLHNVMLDKIWKAESGKLDLSEISVDLDSDVKKIVETKEFQQAYDEIINAVGVARNDFGSIDVKRFCGAKGIRISNNAEKAYNLFLEAYNQLPDNITDVKMLVNEYIKIIEASSEFTNEDKVQIYGGLAVAANSPLFWVEKL